MEILTSITEDEIVESFLSIVRYELKYFNLIGIGVYNSWAKIFGLKYDNPNGIQPYSLLTYVYVRLYLMHRWKGNLIK